MTVVQGMKGRPWMAATVSGTKAAVLCLLEVLGAACGFPEWDHLGSEGARGCHGALGMEGSSGPGCWRELPGTWLRYHLLTLALGK